MTSKKPFAKKCVKCGIEFKGAYKTLCTKCYRRKIYLKERKQVLAQRKAKYLNDPEFRNRQLGRMATQRKKNPELWRERSRKYRKDYPERNLQKMARYYLKRMTKKSRKEVFAEFKKGD